MFVKVCGITNLGDALAAADAGARALGFIFHRASPRFVEASAVAQWIDRIPEDVWRVGVFVDRPPEEVASVCGSLRLQVAQLHGAETASDVPASVRVWKAFRVASGAPPGLNTFPCEAVLLDGLSSGKAFEWKLAAGVARRVILAGGLDEHNVAGAVEQVRPWGVDVCSAVERSAGRKDHARMARFLKACQPELSIPC